MSPAKLLEVGPQGIELGGGRHVKLLDVVGRGASATVYRGLLCSPALGISVSAGLERAVVVKLFPAVPSDEAETVLSELVRTASKVACVDHPNVARVYECGTWRARPFVVSELVAGVPLSALESTYAASKRRVPLDLALFIGAEIAEALAGAQVARDNEGRPLALLHGSVCPRDVLLSWRGEVKVTDFGVSSIRAASSAVRSLRGVAGRVTAMAPEIAQGREPDARSDVFSLGVLLRELLVGPRFPAGLGNSDSIRLAREGFVSPVTFQPHLPERLVAVMARALEVEPALRYPNACVMAADLRREVYALGVGDGRYFLRSTLERDWVQYADEITADRNAAPQPAASDHKSEREEARASVVEWASPLNPEGHLRPEGQRRRYDADRDSRKRRK